MNDLHHRIAADRLRRVGYSVNVNLTSDRFRATIRGVSMVTVRIKNSCVPESLIWQAEQAADLLKRNGRLYA